MPKKAKSKTKQSPKDKFSSSIQPLPPDFASQVLELEIQVETQDSIDAFKNLVELYSVYVM